MKRYKHIFIDLDNTLWDFETNSYNALKNTFINLNILSQVDNFFLCHKQYRLFNREEWEKYKHGKQSLAQLRHNRFQRVIDLYQLQNTTALEIDTLYQNQLLQNSALMDGAIELLKYLHTQYKLYIVTNGVTEYQTKKIKNSGIEAYFQKIFTSQQIGKSKPHKAVFQYALSHCNARKEQSIFIGDHWDRDIVGALSFGIDAIHYSPTSKNENPSIESKQTLFKTNHLLDIKKIL